MPPTACISLSGLLVSCAGGVGHTRTTARPSANPTSATPGGSGNSIAGLTDRSAPTGLDQFSAGYDPVSRRVILWAGATSGPTGTLVAQTWAWDGSSWSQLSPSTQPAPERQASLAVDPGSGHLLLVGGDAFSQGVDSQGNNVAHWAPNEGTWSWDGSTWTRVGDNARQGGYPALAVDQATRQLLVNSPDIRGAETTVDLETSGPAWYGQGSYVWTGSAWAALALPNGVAAPWAIQSAIAYDPISKRLIQFGGSQQYATSDTYAYDGAAWSRLQPATVPPGTPGGLAATDETAGQVVLVARPVDHPDLATTWTWSGANWVRHVVAEPPAEVTDVGRAQMIWDPAIERVVLITSSGAAALRLWIWAGTQAGWAVTPS